jgi:tetratricopeptide (TPR) repeat protein
MVGNINFQEEIEKVEEKLSDNPKSRIFLQLSELYRKSGNLEKATNVLQEGLKIHPDYWTAKVALAKIYLQQNNSDDAIVLLEDVTAKIPDNLLANQLLGDIYFKANDVEKTLKHYKKVLSLYSEDEIRSQRVEELIKAVEEKNIKEREIEEEQSPILQDKEYKKIDDIISFQDTFPKTVKDEGLEIDIPDIDFTKPVDNISESESNTVYGERPDDELIGNVQQDVILEDVIQHEEIIDDSESLSQRDDEGEENEDNGSDEIPTVTLARLYNDQGYRNKALDILEQILDKEPDNNKALKFFDELTNKHKENTIVPVVDSEPEKEEFHVDLSDKPFKEIESHNETGVDLKLVEEVDVKSEETKELEVFPDTVEDENLIEEPIGVLEETEVIDAVQEVVQEDKVVEINEVELNAEEETREFKVIPEIIEEDKVDIEDETQVRVEEKPSTVIEQPVKIDEETSEKKDTKVDDKRLKLLLNWLNGIK